jgi:hypothetical protein
MTSQNPNAPKGDLSLGNNPFIWGNIALLAGVPWLLALSMAGLAVGDLVFPAWFEISLLGFPAIALVAWVQWQQPISPFSLWFVTKPSESLSDRDRKILTLVKQHSNGWYVTGWIAAAVAIVMGVIFCKIYMSAPLAQAIAPFPAGLRLFGILWAEVFFLLSNIFLQAGISALRIKLTAESELNGLKPFAPEKIKNSFTSIGWESPQILRFFEEDAAIADTTKDLIADPVEIISEPEPETIPHAEIAQELEEPEPVEFLAPEIETLDITDASSTEVADVSLDEQFIEEIEELNPFELVEDENSAIESVLDTTEDEPILDEEIAEDSEELEAFETPKEPDLTFLEIPKDSPEPKLEEDELAEADLELSYIGIEEQFTDESEELESLETMEDSEAYEASNTTLTSYRKRSPDFLKKSRKTGSQKKQGFGKSIKRDVVSIPDPIEPNESVKAIEPDAIPDAIATPIEQDFDYELDELIAFNVYVENILKEYLEENDEEPKNAESSDEDIEIDEFADLEALLDGKIENPDNLRDRNS